MSTSRICLPVPGTRPACSAPFWTACGIALAERAGFYTVLNFAVIYLTELGFGAYWPSLLVASGLGTAIYVLPLYCGALADRAGFRKALLAGSALMALGYGALAWPLWMGPEPLAGGPGTPGPRVVLAIGLGLVGLALGRSLLNPVCAAIVQRHSGPEKGLAFGIYFMLTNVGTLAGLGLCWHWRKGLALDAVFAVALGAAARAFLLGASCYRESGPGLAGGRLRGPLGGDLLSVLRDRRFQRFLLASTGFFVLFGQTFILLPLYLKQAVEPNPALELYGMIHPLVAVACQVPCSRLLKGSQPLDCVALASLVVGLAMLCNLPPLFLAGGPTVRWGPLPPAGTLGVLACLGLNSLAMALALPKMFEYMGSLALPGQEGLLLGYTTLPMALGNLLAGCLGPFLFSSVMGAHAAGMALAPWRGAAGWLILAAMGLGSAAAISVLAKGQTPG